MAYDLETAPFELNLAEQFDDVLLKSVGSTLREQIEIDEMSRKEWMDTNKNWLRLASQVREDKSFPWPGASNVKFPLLTVASMQFHARALPNLVNSNKPIKMRIIGKDTKNQDKLSRAERVSTYMSYQILEEMDDWMEEMDRLLFVLPMVGICYKKTFYSEVKGRPCSKMLLPNDMIVNYHAQSFERARMTEVLYMDSNEIYELQKSGVFLDVDINTSSDLVAMDRNAMQDIGDVSPPVNSDMTPYELYESHCWLDLDEDGYKEPYIVTLTHQGQVLRITARWNQDEIFYNDSGDIIKIVPDEYYTPYTFMPDPSSAVSGLGLGSLLGPTNEAVNTIINQLIDAGTLSNQQGGFLGRGIKLRGGATRFRPGEWKIVNTTGQDLRNNIFPMPIREPSGTLFNLLGTLIESGERISAVSDMMVGENPGQNQPATTTMAVLEQGLKVFTSIYKRSHRALAKEYKKLYKLNYMYLDNDKYNTILDQDEATYTFEDFSDIEVDIQPASDPSIVSEAQKSVKSQSLLEKMSMGLPLNVQEVTRRVLEAEGQENIKELMTIEPQPNPEAEMEQMKMQHEAQMDQAQLQLDSVKIEAQAFKDQTGGELNIAKIDQMGAQVEMSGRQQAMNEIGVRENLINNRMKSDREGRSQKGKNESTK
jgi:chaperonin GroES